MRTHQYAHKKRASQSFRTPVSRPTEVQASVQPALIQAKSNEEGLAEHAERLRKFQRLGNSMMQMGPPRLDNNTTSSVQPKPWIQRKLTIGEPGDKYEQEADRVVSQVAQHINAPTFKENSIRESIQREKDLEGVMCARGFQAAIQRKQAIESGEASPDLESAISSARGCGQPLDAGLQQSMGQTMGADFSGVRVHTDAQSDQLNQSIQARAFTTGQDVFFRSGVYQPENRGGQELIAHELTHVVQQTKAIKQANHERPRRVAAPTEERHSTKNMIASAEIKAVQSCQERQVQRKYTFEDDFPGHAQNKLGVGEKIQLEPPNKNIENTNYGWEANYLGKPEVLNTNEQGESEYIAGDQKGEVIIKLIDTRDSEDKDNPAQLEIEVERHQFTIQPPNEGAVIQQPGSKLYSKQGMWHAGFLANLYVLPGDVSYSGMEHKEGSTEAIISGPWSAQVIAHPEGRADWMQKPNGGEANRRNMVNCTDWVLSGEHQCPDTRETGKFMWKIPWLYRVKDSGQWYEFTRVLHIAEDDGYGKATIWKGNAQTYQEASVDPDTAGPISSTKEDQSWPQSIDDDIKQITELFKGMTDTQEKVLRNDLYKRTGIIDGDRRGDYVGRGGAEKISLSTAIAIEAVIDENFVPNIEDFEKNIRGKKTEEYEEKILELTPQYN